MSLPGVTKGCRTWRKSGCPATPLDGTFHTTQLHVTPWYRVLTHLCWSLSTVRYRSPPPVSFDLPSWRSSVRAARGRCREDPLIQNIPDPSMNGTGLEELPKTHPKWPISDVGKQSHSWMLWEYFSINPSSAGMSHMG